MLAPNTDTIDTAITQIKDIPKFIRDSQLREILGISESQAALIGVRGLDSNFVIGYMLGLQTARVVLSESNTLILAKVESLDLL